MAEFDHLLVAVASENDARATAAAMKAHVGVPERITIVHVVEKAGGAPDKAGVEQREAAAAESFDAFREALGGATVETEIVYHTDVADGIIEAARDAGADAIAFAPRGGGLFERLLTGDVTRDLIDRADRPVIALPTGNE